MGNFSHRILGKNPKKNSTGKQFVTPFTPLEALHTKGTIPPHEMEVRIWWKNDAKGLCICGGAKCKCPLLDTYIESYIHIYIYRHFFDHFFPPIFLGGCQFGVALRRTLRFGTPGAFAPERRRWRYSTSDISTGESWWSHFTLGRPPVSKIGDGHDDHDHDTVGDDVLIFHDQMLVLQGWIHVIIYSTICQIPGKLAGKPAVGRTGRNVHSWLWCLWKVLT